MKTNNAGIIKEIFQEYENIKSFFISAIFLVLGLNFISGYVSNYLVGSEKNSIMLIIIGFILCIPSMLYLIINLLNQCKKHRSYEAFIVYDTKKRKLIPVPGYNFSTDIGGYLDCAFNENSALKDIWDRTSLKNRLDSDNGNKENYTAHQLLKDSVECSLLYSLSSCLEDYFCDKKSNKDKLELFDRENLPDVVLNNRLLELISKPMEERPCLKDKMVPPTEEKTKGEASSSLSASPIFILYLKNSLRTGNSEVTQTVGYDGGGFKYRYLSLYLPIGSNVSRSKNDNTIEIKSKDLDISMSVQFEGYWSQLPTGFLENYIGLDNLYFDIHVYELKIDIKVAIKLRLLFSRKDWKVYHSWVDLYLDKLEKNVSKDAFFDLIGWETTHTLIQCLKNTKSGPKMDLSSLSQDLAVGNGSEK